MADASEGKYIKWATEQQGVECLRTRMHPVAWLEFIEALAAIERSKDLIVCCHYGADFSARRDALNSLDALFDNLVCHATAKAGEHGKCESHASN